MTTADVLARLEGVRRSADGWMAKCPAHHDRVPSLSVGEGDGGKTLLFCHAGCTRSAVIAELGLTDPDLFAENGNGERDRPPQICATYDYYDESGGELLFQVVRFTPKGFRQRRPDGAGGWVWNLGKTRRVPYRLPLVVAAVKAGHTVYVVEGERDAHAVEDAGQVATCNPGGAGKWLDTYSASFAGVAKVIVVADDDEPGHRHAAAVAESLRRVGCSDVQIVRPVEGKDVSDHLAAGRTLDELVPVTVDELVSSEDWIDPTHTLAEFIAHKDENAAESLIDCAQGKALPRGGLGLLVAKASAGKTTFAIDLALHAAAGVEFIGLTFGRPLRLLLIENEGPREAFREKLELRLSSWTEPLSEDSIRIWDDPAKWGAIRLSDDEQLLELRGIVERHQIDLCVSDSLTRFGMKGNGTPEETRDFVDLMSKVGLQRDLAFLLLHHPVSKTGQVEDELERVAGAWPPHADAIFVLQKLQSLRARLSYPKLRWIRGERPPSILGFDSDTESFHFLAEETDDERDYVAELTAKLADGEWRTVNALRQPTAKGGIGAREDAIKEALSDERFESAAGESIGLRRGSTFFRLQEAPRGAGGGRGASLFGSGDEATPTPHHLVRGGAVGVAFGDPPEDLTARGGAT